MIGEVGIVVGSGDSNKYHIIFTDGDFDGCHIEPVGLCITIDEIVQYFIIIQEYS